HPSSKGVRVRYSGGKPSLIGGPFAEAAELISGYWLIQARSSDEAVEWASRAPLEHGELEVRQVFEPTDLPADTYGDEIAREQGLRNQLQRGPA
ncbi:MAG: YciI family protein, partial [Candidatus Dormibacteraeota bacterium]|nr:YciI family protein [Candidatus Dormibacteraeota bacterium]